MTRVVVTGAAGFIGSHLCEALLASGVEVVGIDCLTEYYDPARKLENVAPARGMGMEFHQFDLCEARLEPLLDGVDAVFHLAGQPGVRPSFGHEFAHYTNRNLLATQRLLEAGLNAAVGRFVFASSSSVYGNHNGEQVREDDVRAPLSPYGLTKAACEDLIDVYRRANGVSATSLRYFTVYGPRQRPEMAFAQFIERVLGGHPVTVYGDGRQSRDFTYVGDVVRATIAAAERGERPAYNVAGGASTTLIDALRMIERLAGRAAVIDWLTDARGDVRHTRADMSAAASDLGYTPRTPMQEGLWLQVEDALRCHRASVKRRVA